MIRSTYGFGRYVAGETDVVLGTVKSFTGGVTKGVVFCHGGGDLTADPFHDQNALLSGLAEFATVHCGDLGGDPCGNATAVARIGQAITALRSYGVTGKVALVGMSMGFGNAAVYALNNPNDVACIAGVIPATDWQDLGNRYGFTALNAAYPPAYNDTTDGPTHNPVKFAASLPSSLPIRLWSASDDTVCPIAVTQAFVAARPQTELVNTGTGGHSDATVTTATPGIISWVKSSLSA